MGSTMLIELLEQLTLKYLRSSIENVMKVEKTVT